MAPGGGVFEEDGPPTPPESPAPAPPPPPAAPPPTATPPSDDLDDLFASALAPPGAPGPPSAPPEPPAAPPVPPAAAPPPPGQPPPPAGQAPWVPSAGSVEPTPKEARFTKRVKIFAGVGVLVVAGAVVGLIFGLATTPNSPQAAVQGFFGNLIANNDSKACSYVVPSEQRGCDFVFILAGAGHFSVTGNVSTVGSVTNGDRALVSFSGTLCMGGGAKVTSTSCASSGSAATLPSGTQAFNQAWAEATAGHGAGMLAPCVLQNGKWYVELHGSGI